MEKILESLREIERKKKVRILYACETGSRAWGFPSPDSDYDIRFIYMHERDWYLSLNEGRDTLELMENDFDITGWDLKKSLVLLKKSNAPLIERFQSPIEYFSKPLFKEEFKKLIDTYYSPTAVYYHHFSLAKKFWEELKGNEEIRLKKYFYLLRSLLSCNWIVSDEKVVPMHIEGLMIKIDASIRDMIRKLIDLKAGVGEKYLHPVDPILNKWIEETWEKLEHSANNLAMNREDYSMLNQFFLKSLYAENDNRVDKE